MSRSQTTLKKAPSPMSLRAADQKSLGRTVAATKSIGFNRRLRLQSIDVEVFRPVHFQWLSAGVKTSMRRWHTCSLYCVIATPLILTIIILPVFTNPPVHGGFIQYNPDLYFKAAIRVTIDSGFAQAPIGAHTANNTHTPSIKKALVLKHAPPLLFFNPLRPTNAS